MNKIDQNSQKLQALVHSQGLDDPHWIFQLDDIDEPPLFTRYSQIQFLRNLPCERRGPLILKIGLELLIEIADAISSASLETGRRFLACITFMEWEAFYENEIPVPNLALFVDPHDERRMFSGFEYVTPYSDNGKLVIEWLQQLGSHYTSRFVVAELTPQPPEDLSRVYVGLKETYTKKLRSLETVQPISITK